MIHRLLETRADRKAERGQVIVLFALVLLIIMGMGAVTIDGGYGLVQQRRDQNAADFAAQAGTKSLAGLCAGRSIPNTGAVYSEIQAVINLNATDVGSRWTGYYIDSSGGYIPPGSSPKLGTATVVDQTNVTPVSACGVEVALNSTWKTYIANVIGPSTLATSAGARALNIRTSGGGIGIVAMDEVNPHQILGGGSGTFDVFGTILANSAVPYDPWGENRKWCQGASSGCPSPRYVDVVDAKEGSSLILHGNMETVTDNIPLDWCFGANSAGADNGGPPNADKLANTTPDPFNTAICSGSNSVTLQYDKIVTGNVQKPDPLLPGGGQAGLDDPFQTVVQNPVGAGWTEGLCPNESTPPVRSVPAAVGGVVTLAPGLYTAPVILTGAVSVVLSDCGNGYPGVYRFRGGLDLRPDSAHSVTGSNVMVATSSPVPEPGNVVGTVDGTTKLFTATGPGNGAPCWPQSPGVLYNSNGGKQTKGDLTNKCAGTDSGTKCVVTGQSCPSMPNGPYYGVLTYNETNYSAPDASTYGTGTNFSLILGGQGPITLSGPTSGVFHGVALFQDRSTEANFGLNAEPGDSTTQKIYGVAYNGSDPCYGYPKYLGGCTNGNSSSNMYYKTRVPTNPNNFFDTGTPFKRGGVMQAGYGMGTVGSPATGPFPNKSSGQVNVYGPCVVADFNTDGGTTIRIDGGPNSVFATPYVLPGIAPSGNPRITG